jgi:hypothetical protein
MARKAGVKKGKTRKKEPVNKKTGRLRLKVGKKKLHGR